MGKFILACAQEAAGDATSAIKGYTAVLASYPTHAHARYRRGRLYDKRGDKYVCLCCSLSPRTHTYAWLL